MIKTRKKKKTVQNTGKKSQCQCTSVCSHKQLDGSMFCKIHSNGMCKRVSPLNGYEPRYNPDFWNKNYKIKDTHNCFAYAFNINDKKQIKKCIKEDCDIPFHQPGMVSGYPRFSSEKPKTCPNMMARLIGDNPALKMTNFTDRCPLGMSKIALVVDQDEDYHFLRQDSNGLWSHKPGGRKVTNLDASGKHIYDPALANHNWKAENINSDLDYNMFCSYMCVPRRTAVKLKTRNY